MTSRILQSTYTAVDLQEAKQLSRTHREARFLLDNGTVLENDGRIVVGRETSGCCRNDCSPGRRTPTARGA